jgi:hypothetical protein
MKASSFVFVYVNHRCNFRCLHCSSGGETIPIRNTRWNARSLNFTATSDQNREQTGLRLPPSFSGFTLDTTQRAAANPLPLQIKREIGVRYPKKLAASSFQQHSQRCIPLGSPCSIPTGRPCQSQSGCRRAVRSYCTPLPHSSRLPEVPQARPRFTKKVYILSAVDDGASAGRHSGSTHGFLRTLLLCGAAHTWENSNLCRFVEYCRVGLQ